MNRLTRGGLYEKFRKNFNSHDFDKYGPPVAQDIHVHSNGTELRGRDAFVARIKRYQVPFPDLKINDLMTIVGGNCPGPMAADGQRYPSPEASISEARAKACVSMYSRIFVTLPFRTVTAKTQ